jgi:hypothetical protein
MRLTFSLKGIRTKKKNSGENCTLESFIICTLPDTIRMIKSKWTKWAEHVAVMGEADHIQSFGGTSRKKETTGKI